MLKLNTKVIDRVIKKTLKETKDNMLEYISENWSSNSVAGEPPEVITGELKDSIKGETTNNKIFITSDKDYAVYLELGTQEIEPRPFMRPCLNRSFNMFVKNARINIKKG